MTTRRPTAIHALSRRSVLQCLGLGALATAWPASATVLAVEDEDEDEDEESADSLPAWLTFPEQQWQRITPAEAGIDTVAYEQFLAQSQIGPKGWGGTQPMVSIAKTNTGGFPFGVEVGTSGNFAFPPHLITGPGARK